MKRKLTLNEELNRMKGLMSYENGQYKNPIISEQSNYEKIQMQQKIIDDNNYAIKQITEANRNGRAIYYVGDKTETVKVDIQPLNANFYNNMISLDRGLMDNTNQESVMVGIKSIIESITKQNLSDIKITIKGTASSAEASDKPDVRILEKDPTAKLDHRGSDYNGEDANNDYLAKERATSIAIKFKELLPDAEYVITSDPDAGGGAGEAGDEHRYINVIVEGVRTTEDKILSSTLKLKFTSTDGYYTVAEWNEKYKETGCQIKDVPDPNARENGKVQSLHTGARFLSVNTGTGGRTYNWMGDGFNWGGTVIDYTQDPESTSNKAMKFEIDKPCPRIDGITNISGNLNEGDKNIQYPLKTSGYFTNEEIKKIKDQLAQAVPMGNYDDGNIFTMIRRENIDLSNYSYESFMKFVNFCITKGIISEINVENLMNSGALFIEMKDGNKRVLSKREIEKVTP